MQHIGDWLEKLGMSEYAQRFAESDIDTSVLRHLTDQDLKELGSRSVIDERCWRRLRSLSVPPKYRRSLH
jgi:SAM domain (Sterile alpha motif)